MIRLKKAYFKKGLFLFLFVYLMFGICTSQPFFYKFNYLTVDEGLSHTDANDIAQDKQGYIWIATFFGLDRFDGYSIKKFYNDNEPLNNAFKNRLNCLYPDEEGNIWLGTEGGLQCFLAKSEKYIDLKDPKKPSSLVFSKIYKPAGNFLFGLTENTLRSYIVKGSTIREQSLNIPQGVQFYDMAPAKDGLLYLCGNKGLWMLDKKNNLRNVPVAGLSDVELSRVSFNNSNELLVTTANKLFLVTNTKGIFSIRKQFFCTEKSSIKNIVQDNKFDYWVNAGSNLLRLDSNFNFIQDANDKNSLHNLNSNSLTKIFVDRSACLWVCTFGGGVNYCDLNEKKFYTLQHNPAISNSLSGNHVRSVLADGENIWVGTTANGLNLYNVNTQTFTYYNTYNSPVKLKNDVITALAFDNDKNLWIGNGNGIQILKPNRKELWQPPGYNNFPTYVLDVIVKDCYGNMWFGNHSNRFGVIWKDKQNYYHVKYYGEGYFILADENKPQLFVSSTHGLKRIIIDAEGNVTKTFDYQASSKPNTLSSDYTYPVCKQNDSIFWIGTIGGGLNRLTLQKDDFYIIKSYGAAYGVFNDVESMEVDNTGNIWMGGNGLECFNPVTNKLIRYDKNDGLQGNSFKVGASNKGADGRLYFGGINGLNYFYPDQIKPNEIDAKPILSNILINNQKPHYGNADTSGNFISEAIGYSNDLKLDYLQNNFVIFFSAMHFANPSKCKYRYKLTGFDKDWKYTDGKNPAASYSNLDYSTYKFIVEATNNDGIWSKTYAETAITITPPWWQSDVAKTAYALLIISFLFGIYIYQARWYRLKRELEVNAVNERKKEEMHGQREELYRQQLTLFTNISHEFRTPLTLILSPLENLISQNKNSMLDNSYQLMLRNAKRLINLVNELMNFKKVADSKIKLQVQPLIICEFCKHLAWEFQNLATGKKIDFELTNYTEKNITGLVDIQVLEKIIFNLLANAFKYTYAGGKICFDTFFDIENFKPSFASGFQLLNKKYRAKKYIYFRVADSGIGITEESLPKIFERYYRVSKNHLGSGVGLALVKSLTQLHKGDIYVYSERYKGTEIVIGIPWGEENYDVSEIAAADNQDAQLESIDTSVLLPLPEHDDDHHPSITELNKSILLVDDNRELRSFLKQTFENLYHIYEADDGKSAVEIATKKIPDLIISDVMMPVMDGIEFCKAVKEKFETRHIPFIILSAKDALITKIEGMESGADYYFAKPLSIDLLRLTVHNIFEQSEKLKQRYTNNYLAEAAELVHSEKDKEFFNTLTALVEENIDDENLDADFLCEHLYISRTKLYQKIKSISGQSVGDFIRTIRLKKAIQIMTHEVIAMNDVADRVGLQSSSNFSRAFKKEYGKSPLQFMQSLKKN